MIQSPAPPRKSWSITAILTSLYSLSTCILLFLAGMFAYRDLVNHLERQADEFLADKIQLLAGTLSETPADIEDLREEMNSQGQFTEYNVRIMDESNRILHETAGMNAILPSRLFPPPLKTSRNLLDGHHRELQNGKSYRLMSALATVGGIGNRRIIQVALDFSAEESMLRDYKKRLLAALTCGTLLSALLGLVIARKGLAPLTEITKMAQGITAADLPARIGHGAWPHELQALAAEFDEMLARLQDSFNRLSRFSADLAHELRTPINNLMGEAEVALTRARGPEEYRQVLESSLEEYSRLSHMIESLLFLARAENAETPVQKKALNAGKELDAIREFYEVLAAEHNIQILCEGTADLNADPVLLRRALSNLLANSIQYTPAGGKITLRVTVSENNVRISVSDTGCGVPAESLPRIFDRFFRTDRAKAQFQQGAGLGLAIVKSVMDLHQGTVGVQSELYVGTTVSLNFPPE